MNFSDEADTEARKEAALKALAHRRELSKNIKRVDNEALYEGSPMFYYCKGCGAEIVLPEDHRCPVPRHCDICAGLERCGWLADKTTKETP